MRFVLLLVLLVVAVTVVAGAGRTQLLLFDAQNTKAWLPDDSNAVQVQGPASGRLLHSPANVVELTGRYGLPQFTRSYEVRFSPTDVEVHVQLEGLDPSDPDRVARRFGVLHEACLYVYEMIGSHLGRCSNLKSKEMWTFRDPDAPADEMKRLQRRRTRDLKSVQSSEDFTYFARGSPFRDILTRDMTSVRLRDHRNITQKVRSLNVRHFDSVDSTGAYLRWDGLVKGWVGPFIEKLILQKLGADASVESAYVRVFIVDGEHRGETLLFLQTAVDVEVASGATLQLDLKEQFESVVAMQGTGQFDENSRIYTLSEEGSQENAVSSSFAPSLSSRLSGVRMVRRLSSDGLSTKIETSLLIPKSHRYFKQNCSVAIVEHIPEGVFADLDELRKVEGYQFDVLNDVHIERPAFLSQHTAVAAVRSGVKFRGWVNFSIPIHFRYQNPSATRQFRKVRLVKPFVSVSCPVPKGCLVSGYPLWIGHINNQELCPNWEAVPTILDSPKPFIMKQVPVGDKSKTQLVNIVTLSFSGIGVLLISWSVLSKSFPMQNTKAKSS